MRAGARVRFFFSVWKKREKSEEERKKRKRKRKHFFFPSDSCLLSSLSITMLLHAHVRPSLAARNSRPAPLIFHSTPRCARATARASVAEQQSAVEGDGAQTSSSPSRRRHLLFLAAAAASATALLSPALADETTPSPTSSITPPATVFVAGATGETGRRTVAALAAAGYRVRAGVRDRAKAEALLLSSSSSSASSPSSSSSSSSSIDIVDLDLETMTVEQLAQAVGEDAAAVVCCVGSRPRSPLDKKAAAAVDEFGTINLIRAARSKPNVAKFVLLSSILTNGKAVGQGTNPAFVFLEVFSGGVLSRKLAAENALRSAGFASWSVVRPGGLASKTPEELGAGGIYLSGEDTIFGESEEHGAAVSRDAVADVLVAAVRAPASGVAGGSSGKVVEVVASKGVPTRLSAEELDKAWAAV